MGAGRGGLVLLLAACAAPAPQSPQESAPDSLPATQPARLPSRLDTLPRLARGRRCDLPLAQLLVPEGLTVPADGVVPAWLHFQGGVTIAEENFARMGQPGVLIASRLAGRSGDFSRPYQDPGALRALLAAAEIQLQQETGRSDARLGALHITFFSAGYGAVREFLKDPALFRRIATLVSADSIYADVVAPTVRAPRVEHMLDFARFAQAAARGEKTFVLVHGMYPTDYAATFETADFLLASVAGRRTPVVGTTRRGVPIAAEAHAGGFHLYSFAESGPGIHVDCLYLIDELVRAHVGVAGKRPGEMVTRAR